MKKIEEIIVNGRRYAVIPFSLLDSFSRTYDSLSAFARTRGFIDIEDEGESHSVIKSFHMSHPHILRIAIGRLPQFIGENSDSYLLVIFPDKDKNGAPIFEAGIADMVHDEPEFENAVCIFRA